MSAPLQVRSPNFFFYTNALAAIYQSTLWIPDQDWGLAQDPDVWEKVQLDPVVRHAIQTRLVKVAGRPSTIEAGGSDDASKKLADIVEQMLDRVENLAQAKLNLAKAVLLGRTYGYIRGERTVERLGIAGSPALAWWMPRYIQDVDRRRIRLSTRSTTTEFGRRSITNPRVELADIDVSRWTILRPDQYANFVKLTYDDEEGRLGYGRGNLGAIYFYHYAKGIVLREGLNLVERWSQGMVVATADLDREGSTGKTNEDKKTAFLNSVEKMRARNTLVLGGNDKIDIKWPSGEASKGIQDMLNYLDTGVMRLILGSVLPTGGSSGDGSRARAEVEERASEDILQYDALLLDAALTRDLIGQFVTMNRVQLAAMGLDKAKKPRFLPQRETRSNPKERAEVAAILLKQKVPLKKSELYAQTGWSVPLEGDDVIEGQSESPFGEGGDPTFLEKQRDESGHFANPRQAAASSGGERTADRERKADAERAGTA